MKTDKIWPKKKVLKKVRFFLFLFALAAIHNRTVYVYHRSRIFVKTRRKYSMSGKISNTSQCLLFMYLALLVFCFIFCSSCTYITYVFPSKNILFCTPPPSPVKPLIPKRAWLCKTFFFYDSSSISQVCTRVVTRPLKKSRLVSNH